MSKQTNNVMNWIGGHASRVTVLILASVWPGQDFAKTDRWLQSQRPLHRKVLISGVLLSLLLLAMVAAAFGPIGLALYFLGVILLVR